MITIVSVNLNLFCGFLTSNKIFRKLLYILSHSQYNVLAILYVDLPITGNLMCFTMQAIQGVLLSCSYIVLDYAQTGLIASVFFFKVNMAHFVWDFFIYLLFMNGN